MDLVYWFEHTTCFDISWININLKDCPKPKVGFPKRSWCQNLTLINFIVFSKPFVGYLPTILLCDLKTTQSSVAPSQRCL